MRAAKFPFDRTPGFTLVELMIVIAGAAVLLGIAVPVGTTVLNGHRLTLCAGAIANEMQYARMKAVTSNEPVQVSFPTGQRVYQVQSTAGAVLTGPFALPAGVDWNTDGGGAVTFPGRIVSFLPGGNLPTAGNGSGGRVRLRNQVGSHIDVIVAAGGMVRMTPVYTASTAPF
jgi:prepilin-type N-terminal cleavage/methylation domain-containing protein